MKRLISIVVLLWVLVSCEDQVKFNNPALQGLKDNVVWRATLITAEQSADGSLKIMAYQKNEILTLTTVAANVQTYPLGENFSNRAVLTQNGTDGITIFSTGIDSGDGEIVITELDAVNHTVTGEFNFNANNESQDPITGSSVSFRKGIFYKVPLTNTVKK
jgi:hypothetical protein